MEFWIQICYLVASICRVVLYISLRNSLSISPLIKFSYSFIISRDFYTIIYRCIYKNIVWLTLKKKTLNNGLIIGSHILINDPITYKHSYLFIFNFSCYNFIFFVIVLEWYSFNLIFVEFIRPVLTPSGRTAHWYLSDSVEIVTPLPSYMPDLFQTKKNPSYCNGMTSRCHHILLIFLNGDNIFLGEQLINKYHCEGIMSNVQCLIH
jgi:hypothetical protein